MADFLPGDDDIIVETTEGKDLSEPSSDPAIGHLPRPTNWAPTVEEEE
jgi:hypothetical protein